MVLEAIRGLLANELAYAAVVIILFAIIARATNYALKHAHKFAHRTKTDLDDKIFAALRRPLFLALILVGISLATRRLTALAAYQELLAKIYAVLWLIIGGYVGFKIFDVFITFTSRAMVKRTGAPVTNIMRPLERIVKALILLTILFVLLGIFGIDITPFLLGWGLLGFAIVLALQPVLSDVFSGFTVTANKSFRVGTTVILPSGEICEIMDIRTQNTLLFDLINKHYISIANTDLAKQKITILENNRLRLTVQFTVPSEKIKQATETALKALRGVDGIEKEPKPKVHIIEVSERPKLELAFWVSDAENKHEIMDVVNAKLVEGLSKL